MYTYDPTKTAEAGKDRMRFELGDVMVDGGYDTCVLTDEEYNAVFERFDPKTKWKRAKLELIKSVLFRFSYEVDTKVGPLSLSLSERRQHWQDMYDELKNEVGKCAVPSANRQAISGHGCFYKGMHDNSNGGRKGGDPIVP